MIHLRRIGVSFFALTALSAAGAFAQQAPAKGAAPQVEEIVVTARRVSEKIQSVPVSIAAFSGAQLRQQSITTPEDLMQSTPGVYLVGSGGRLNTMYAIRGQSKAVVGVGQPAVVSYFSEVPDPTLASRAPMYDIASVQVLKGPQGTLFGRNTTGGAVLITPQAPTYAFGGYGQIAYGNYDMKQAEGALNIPVVKDRIALRLAGQITRRDGYTKNLSGGEKLDDVHDDAFRVSLLVEPADNVKNLTTFDYYKTKTNGTGSRLAEISPPGVGSPLLDLFGIRSAANAALARENAAGFHSQETDINAYQNAKRIGLTNRTDIDLGPVQFTNIFGYRAVDVEYYTNADGVDLLLTDGTGPLVPFAGVPILFVNGFLQNHLHQWTEEGQLKGKLFNDRVSWLLGAFYLKSNPTGANGTDVDIFANGPMAYQFYTETSKALFGNIGVDLSDLLDGLKFNAGYRYSWDKAHSCTASSVNLNPPHNVQPSQCVASNTAIVGVNNVDYKSKAPTWILGLDYQLSKDVFLYVTSRRGYRTGGVNNPSLGGTLAPFQQFGPEKVTDYEAGIRTDWHVGEVRGRFNVSAFTGKYKGVQIPLSGLSTQAGCIANDPVFGKAPFSPDGDCNPANDPTGGTLSTNVGTSRVRGLDIAAMVAPTRELSFDAAVNLLDPKALSFNAGSVLAPYLGQAGIPFYYTAKGTISAGAHYVRELPEELGQVGLHVDMYRSSSIKLTDYQSRPYAIANARLDWNGVAGTPVDISLFGRNILQKNYYVAANVASNQLPLKSAIPGEPRTFGIQLRYSFGQ